MNLRLDAARPYRALNDGGIPPTQLSVRRIINSVRLTVLAAAVCLALLPIRFVFAATDHQSEENPPGVELCYYADGPGREISGQINGRPFTNHARVFRVTVDEIEQDAFCTDLHNPIGSKQCHSNSGIGVTDPMVACVLQQHPPGKITDDDEAAAVQSAIWHFSDGFELSSSESIFNRYQTIISGVEEKYANGACAPVENWQLSVDVEDSVHFLQPIGESFRPDQHLVFVKLFGEDKPIANHTVQVSTDVGSLSWGAERGSVITVQTDGDGLAVIAVAHDQPGTATVEASTTVQLPVGTRVDPGPSIQKLVLSGTDSYRLRQEQQVEWIAGEKLVVKKFHDINRDGLFNHTDELIDWSVEICEAGTDNCFVSELGESGSRIFALNPEKQYDVCELMQDDWVATTPVCHQNLSLPQSLWFGNVQLPALLIQKFHDLNGNGLQDDGEPGIVGWPFQIMRVNGEELISTYSGNTDIDGRLGYSNIGYHTYQINELFPSGETWYPSTPASQSVAVREKQTYTATFGNLKPATLTVDKTWLIDSVEVTPPAGTTTTACVRRTGPGDAAMPISPMVDGQELTLDSQGYYCYDRVVESVTFTNLWPGLYEIIEIPPGDWTPVVIPEAVFLESGQNFHTAGFVNSTTTAAIGDYVWFDRNQNGIQESGERGVADVVVHLLGADGSELDQTSTDSVGQYLFDNLMPGDYYLRFEPPVDFEVSPPNQLSSNNVDSDTIDSDIDPTTGETALTTLLPGEFDMSWDAGIYMPTSPSFQFEKYINGNEADSLDDAVVSETNQILAFRYEVVNDGDTPLIWSALIDDVFGDLSLECRLPKDIAVGRTEACTISRLAEEFPNGKVNIGTVTLLEGTPEDQPPGNNPPLPTQSDEAWYRTPLATIPATLGDKVWLDVNQNGLQDNGEEGVPAVQAMLLDEDGQSRGTITATNDEGLYTFDELAPGNYIVEFTIPYGYTLTQPFQGSDRAIDSNASLVDLYTARTPVVTLNEGDTDLTIDAGLVFAPPRLQVAKESQLATINPGSLVTYTIHYTNAGGSDAVNVNIVEQVPQHTVFVAANSTSGWACDSNNSGSVCTYNLGSVPANFASTEPILFVVRVNDPLPITVTQIVNVISIRDDGNPDLPIGSGYPAVIVPVQHFVLGEPPQPEPIPNQRVIYLPLID